MAIHRFKHLLSAHRRLVGQGVLIAVIVGGLGYAGLGASSAATFAANTEAEAGTMAGNAGAGDTVGASANASVKFGLSASPTPPPPPPGTLAGWQLNETNVGLAPFGLSCASLPKYAGGYSVPAGTTISGKRIETDVDLSAGNILIEKSCIRPMPGSGFAKGDSLSTAAGPNCSGSCPAAQVSVTIRDSEFDGTAWDSATIAYSCAFGGLANLQRNYVHDMGSGLCFNKSGNYGSALVENNYVTGLRAYGSAGTTGSHNESATVRDFDPRTHTDRQLTIRNNRFVSMSGNDSGALFIQAYAGFVNNVTVEGNLLETGGYQMPLEMGANGYGNNMQSINNRFISRELGPGYVSGGSGWAVWQDNYVYDATKTDGKGAVIPEPQP